MSIDKDVPHHRQDNQEQDKANDRRTARVMIPGAKRSTVEEAHWLGGKSKSGGGQLSVSGSLS